MKLKKMIALLSLTALLLTGCADSQGTKPDSEPLDKAAQLETDLKTLTQKRRPIGSDGEAAAVDYLKGRFEALGYQVTLQNCTNEEGKTGSNVIAVRGGSKESDILVISAHHDSFPTAFGANDDGSGVGALLYIAGELADAATDTELRFISFTDEESGKNGSRAYVESLSGQERGRVVGCIQLDMLGGLGSDGSIVCTTDGADNWLSELLQQKDVSLTLGTETASDHSSFQLAGIPAILVTQNARGYLYHSAADTADQLDYAAIRQASDAVAETVREIASADTPSYQALTHEQAGELSLPSDASKPHLFLCLPHGK